jgi:glutathione S-transferase
VNRSEKQKKSEHFLAMNSFGKVPVLTDDDFIIRDSQAILVYLVNKFGNVQLFPNDAEALAACVAWLFRTANEVALGPNRLQLHHKFGRGINIEESKQISLKLMDIL